MKRFISLVLFVMISGIGTFAQTNEGQDISDQELKQFASAFQQIQVVNQEAQQEMAKAVEEEGLEIQRYVEIQQAEQDSSQETTVTDDEMKKYERASTKIEEIHVEAQQNMVEKITDEGLSIDRYQEIATAVQHDPVLQQKLQEYMQQG
jgi:hypothetical protein